MPSMTFRDLVESWLRRDRPPHVRPRPFSVAARRCGVSRQHLYALMAGTKGAPEWTVERIAIAFDVTPATVRGAIAATAAEAAAAKP